MKTRDLKRATGTVGTKAAAIFVGALLAFSILAVSQPCMAGIFQSGPKVVQGEAATPFVTKDLKGNEIDLADLIGEKAILLDFWSIYCSPCVEEMPTLIGMYEKYNEMGLEVFGISLDSHFNARRLNKFIESYEEEIPYPIIHDSKAEIRSLYGVTTLPTAILVDADGTISIFFLGFSEAELETAIKQALR
jgi:peroxiredoxin